MNLTLRSKVNESIETVSKRFDQDLFEYLLPPGAQLIEFGGSEKGDVVHLKLPIAGEWISEITENGTSGDEWYFIDVGTRLPFPIKKWQHRHILRSEEKGTVIIDDINFSTGSLLGDLLFYPILFLSFRPRVGQYKKYFG